MMKHIIMALFFMILSTPAWSQSESSVAKPVLSVKGASIQGSILFLRLTGVDAQTEAKAEFDSITVDFVKDGGELAITLPIRLNAPSGAHPLTVTAKTTAGALTFKRTVNVLAHTYGRQNLWLSESQLAKYDDPQADRDNAAIKKALGFVTEGISWTNRFIVPTQGHVVTLFGLKRFYNSDPEPEFHRGIDIAAPLGQKIKASQNGIVRFAKRNLVLHGDSVVIDHGKGVGTLYLHMNTINVKEGQIVSQGDVIGTVGSKGASTGPHLHWAAYSQGEPVDPGQLTKTMPADMLK